MRFRLKTHRFWCVFTTGFCCLHGKSLGNRNILKTIHFWQCFRINPFYRWIRSLLCKCTKTRKHYRRQNAVLLSRFQGCWKYLQTSLPSTNEEFKWFEPEVGQLCSVFKIEIIGLVMFLNCQSRSSFSLSGVFGIFHGVELALHYLYDCKKCMVLHFYLILLLVQLLYDMKRVI